MEIIKKETVFEGEYLRFVNKTAVTQYGQEIIWETVERKNLFGNGSVTIIGITEDRELILERNWRASLESYIIQFPGALTDIEGETELQTAHRELFDETGYTAGKMTPVLSLHTSPDLSPIKSTCYFASDLRYTGGNTPDHTEEIEILTIPVEDLYSLFTHMPDNTSLDYRVPGIIWMLQQRKLI